MLPSPLGSWRSRLAAFSVLVGTASLAKMDRSVTVLIYVDTSKQVVDPDHIEIFAGTDAAETWLEENDPEALPSRWFWNRQRRPTASRGQLAVWGLEGPSSREPHLDSYRDRPFLIERPGNRPGQIEVILRAETQPAKRMRMSVSVQRCTHLGPYKYGHGSLFLAMYCPLDTTRRRGRQEQAQEAAVEALASMDPMPHSSTIPAIALLCAARSCGL